MARFGMALPELRTEIPGPASRLLAARLARVESRNVTRIANDSPIFWARARGANVADADGNVYVDLTAGFAVAAAGHADPHVARAVAAQARRLPHALGDVYPADVKVALLERLAELAPGGLEVGILAGGGAEAVEAALKTAVLRTGRHGVLAFTGAYHGLTYGALAATWRADFRRPFEPQLHAGVRFAPYPDPHRPELCRRALDRVEHELLIAEREGRAIGTVLVEPIQGRGGLIVPPPGFLPGLRELCDGRRVILVFDEVYTGFGRTGRWFACDHEGVVPDVLVVGKALGGGIPISATIGTREVMEAWPPSAGEAIHTSTFLGNPVACAAALAHLDRLRARDLVGRAARTGRLVERRLKAWRRRYPLVADVRGRGLMWGAELVGGRRGRGPMRGVELDAGDHDRKPATAAAHRIVSAALREGVLLLAEGPAGNVLAITPPLSIGRRQLGHALDVIEGALARESPGS